MNKDLMIEIKADTKKAVADINKLKTQMKNFGTNVKSSNIREVSYCLWWV